MSCRILFANFDTFDCFGIRFSRYNQGFPSTLWAYEDMIYAFLRPMGLSGLEPPTSRLSGVRSNRLSYKPSFELIRSIYSELIQSIYSYSGSHLLSHAVSSIVPSAVWVLTIVFGMRTGVSPKRIATGNA